MIVFDDKNQVFHLSTPCSSYVFRLNGEYMAEHLYYGKKLSNLTGITNLEESFVPAFSAINDEYNEQRISTDSVLQEYAFYGSCDLRKPSFHAIYENGSRITKMKFVSYKINVGKPKLSGLPATYTEADTEADTLELLFRDELTALELTYVYTVFTQYDAITRCVKVKNTGESDVNIKEIMSMNVDFPRADFDFIHLPGAWCRERHIERRSVISGRTHIESRRGSSSHHHSPFFALADKNTTEVQGEVYGFSFVYSGNFEAGVEVDSYGNTRAYMGINSFDFNWLLKKDEEFITPEVIMVHSANGIGEMSRTYHKLYRTRLARGKYRDKERAVLINNWEATYMNFTEEKILEIAKIAAKVGIEMLVLDDGWFGKRNDSTSSLGDWFPNKEKLPNGISGLAKKINELGLKFGLWFEPEMISEDSELYREHPDWCLYVEGRGKSRCRNQLMLDLSREDVRNYIVETLSRNLENTPIEYVKWDMNRNMSEIGSSMLPPERQSEVAHRYVLGLYDILERITQRFPDVLFEGCSGGGGRFDAGMMYYFNQYWTSDDSDAVERMFIQHGTSLVMPSCFMSAHVSASPNHQIDRVTSLETRSSIAFCGQFGYELDITKMTDEELNQIKVQIEKYKEIRDIIHTGDMYRIMSPFEGNQVVWQYVSDDKKKIVVCYGTINSKPEQQIHKIRLEGIQPDKNYKCLEDGKVYSGDILMNYGFSMKEQKDFSAKIIIFEIE